MEKDQSMGNGWRRATNWRSVGNEFLYAKGGGFKGDGYYLAPQSGYFICSAVMRLDSADRSRYLRLLITVNENKDINNGLHAMNGYGSSDYRPLTVAGSIYLEEKD